MNNIKVNFTDSKGNELYLGNSIKFKEGYILYNHTGELQLGVRPNRIFTITWKQNRGICASIEIDKVTYDFPLNITNINYCELIK